MGLFKRLLAENTPSTSANAAVSSSAPIDHHQKKSSISSSDVVTEASLQVWRGLPSKIRHDPSMVSFQQEDERWKGDKY